MTSVICWVKPKVGESKPYKSKNGLNFKDKAGNSYNAPEESKHEVTIVKTFTGKKYWAFYKEGHQNPIPIDPEAKWKQTTNHDSDVEILVEVTRKALSEAGSAKLERQLTLGGIALVLLFMLLQHIL